MTEVLLMPVDIEVTTQTRGPAAKMEDPLQTTPLIPLFLRLMDLVNRRVRSSVCEGSVLTLIRERVDGINSEDEERVPCLSHIGLAGSVLAFLRCLDTDGDLTEALLRSIPWGSPTVVAEDLIEEILRSVARERLGSSLYGDWSKRPDLYAVIRERVYLLMTFMLAGWKNEQLAAQNAADTTTAVSSTRSYECYTVSQEQHIVSTRFGLHTEIVLWMQAGLEKIRPELRPLARMYMLLNVNIGARYTRGPGPYAVRLVNWMFANLVASPRPPRRRRRVIR